MSAHKLRTFEMLNQHDDYRGSRSSADLPALKKLITSHNTRELQFASNIWISFHHNGTHTLSEKTKSVLNRNIQTDFAALKQFVYRSSEHPRIRKQQLAKPLDFI